MRLKHVKQLKSGSVYIEPEKFRRVDLNPRKTAIECTLADGKKYELLAEFLTDCEPWDFSGIQSVDIVEHGFGVMVRQNSGEVIDFPVDYVLYHCEPRYEFHKSRQKPAKIGSNIKILREKREWTLERLSAETGIAVPNLSRLEHDNVQPTLETIQKMAHAFGVSIPTLITNRR